MTVVEHDYKHLHPRLLYQKAGKVLLEDAYELPGWPREITKVAFNIMLNTKRPSSARAAIALLVGGPGSHEHARQIMEAFEKRHAPIAHNFYSGVGLYLQNVDAGMAEKVMLQLKKKGIVSLPIHDSFLVQKQYKQDLEEAMDQALKTAFKEH